MSRVTLFACGRARGVTESDISQRGFQFANPMIFVGLVEWAGRIFTE